MQKKSAERFSLRDLANPVCDASKKIFSGEENQPSLYFLMGGEGIATHQVYIQRNAQMQGKGCCLFFFWKGGLCGKVRYLMQCVEKNSMPRNQSIKKNEGKVG